MNKQAAIAAAEEWLRGRFGEDLRHGKHRVGVEPGTVLTLQGWCVPYGYFDAEDPSKPGPGIFPAPAVLVPEDGRPPELYIPRQDSAASDKPEIPDFQAMPAWPEPSEADHEIARDLAGGGVAVVDPEFYEDLFAHLGVPSEAVFGWREVDQAGQLTGGGWRNENYRIGPLWRGFPIPDTPLDALLNYENCGWYPEETLIWGMLDLDVYVPATRDWTIRTAPTGTDLRALDVFSSRRRLPADCETWFRVRVRDVIAALPDVRLDINLGQVPSKSFVVSELQSYVEAYPAPADEAGYGWVREQPVETSPPVQVEIDRVVDDFGFADADQARDALVRRLRFASGQARANQHPLSVDECLRHLRGCAWELRNETLPEGAEPTWPDDPVGAGLELRYAEDGTPRPCAPHFGKFSRNSHENHNLAWHRVVGAYVGFALGDALGSAVEFDSWETIQEKFGPHGLTELAVAFDRPGQISALTQQLLFCTEGLIRGAEPVAGKHHLTSAPLAVQHAYQRWLVTQGVPWSEAGGRFAADRAEPDGWLVRVPELAHRRSPDLTTLSTIRSFARRGEIGSPERRVNKSQGAAALLSALPAAVAAAHGLDRADGMEHARALALELAQLTHGHNTSTRAAMSLAGLMFSRMLAEDTIRPVHLLLQPEYSYWQDNDFQSERSEFRRALQEARVRREQREVHPLAQLDSLGDGATAVSVLTRALYAASRFETEPETALLVAVNHSGNSAMTAAVTGALLGAKYGVPGLPSHWIDQLELRFLVENVASDAFWHFNRFSPLTVAEQAEMWTRRYPRS
ncbi:ADP-ribosylglycohydrolase family protein [Goodfellowiella coeruleoviolacea]|uniref:ADP-ribosylglycohydrolase n=1 Tax=Goodfellowiella coeruleoviolacea TaxID=334858 RepID=A0AAE3KEL4_9PSEU|nr:ADP-ribosylglycohydrolase family protein [Goodfellowiella coeruleoviolacea]MCP2163970.1 ADP-ribosylglycohydrolase [Goodfellowiella coeruleoviolacea]